MPVNILVVELDGPGSAVMAAGAFDKPAVDNDGSVCVTAQQFDTAGANEYSPQNPPSQSFFRLFGLITGIFVIHGLILLLSCVGQQKVKHGLARW